MRVLGYSPWGNGTSVHPLDEIFDRKQDCTKQGFEGIDAFVLWGGTDIPAAFYRQQPSRMNQQQGDPTNRDVWEWNAINYCVSAGIPIIGICRGAQMLCAAAGGSLFQDVEGHGTGWHSVKTVSGEVMQTTTCHHQMMDLRNTDHTLLAWSLLNLSDKYISEGEVDLINELPPGFKEPELVLFPKLNALAIQGHPEWMKVDHAYTQYFLSCVEDYLFFPQTC